MIAPDLIRAVAQDNKPGICNRIRKAKKLMLDLGLSPTQTAIVALATAIGRADTPDGDGIRTAMVEAVKILKDELKAKTNSLDPMAVLLLASEISALVPEPPRLLSDDDATNAINHVMGHNMERINADLDRGVAPEAVAKGVANAIVGITNGATISPERLAKLTAEITEYRASRKFAAPPDAPAEPAATDPTPTAEPADAPASDDNVSQDAPAA